MITDAIGVFGCEPHNDLLSERAENEAYCLADVGKTYAVYFPDGGSVVLTVGDTPQTLAVQWFNAETSAWQGPAEPISGESVRLAAPGEGHWVAMVSPG